MKLRFTLFLLLLTLLLTGCGFSLAEDITPPPDYQSPTPGPTKSPLYPLELLDLSNGASIYAEKCAPCHGDQGLGDGTMAASLQKPPAAIGDPNFASKASLVNWYTIVTEGNINSFMPPFNGSLNDKQRWDVVAYALSLGGFNVDDMGIGAQVYQQYCEECHGADGKLVSTADFSDQIMMSKLSQNDLMNFVVVGVGTMQGFGDTIPKNELRAVASYMRAMTVDSSSIPGSASVSDPTTEQQAPESTTPKPTADAPAEEPTSTLGDVVGVITNGSAAQPAAGINVVLHGFTHDFDTQQFTEQITLDTTTSADGSFAFADMDLATYQAFYISVDYSGLVYESEPAFSTGNETSLDIPLTIYDTTTDTSGLYAEQSHIILDYTTLDQVQVIEFLIISNNSNATVVSPEGTLGIIDVPLPAGYTDLQFEEGVLGGRFIETPNGFADTMSVYPGPQSHQVVFAYQLPLEKSWIPFFGKPNVTVDQIFTLRSKSISILIPEGLQVIAPGLTAQPIADMGNGARYQTFEARPDAANYNLKFTVKGSTSTSAVSDTSSQTGIVVGVAALGLVLILAAVFMYFKSRKEEVQLMDETEDEGNSASDEEILDAIIALDDQYKSGNISDSAYTARRQDLIDQLSGDQE